MSTDRISINFENFLDRLDFKDLALHGLDCKVELETCFNAAKSIWDRPLDLKYYTIHGLTHSANIINFFSNLEPVYQWSNYEKLVFCMAALIHDVGMQYNSWAELPVKGGAQHIWEYLKTPQISLSENDIRKDHIQLGSELIKCEVDNLRKWDSPPPFCTGTELARNLLFHAFVVAFAHSDGEWWENCKDPKCSIYQRRILPGGQLCRPRLLAGTLRLCDELDSHFARISNPECLWAESVPDLSRLHWLSCFFVENTQIETDNGVVIVRMTWRSPRKATPELTESIREFLAEMRERRINRNGENIVEMYKLGHENESLNIRVDGLDKDPIPFVHEINPQLVQILTNFKSIIYKPVTGSVKQEPKVDALQVSSASDDLTATTDQNYDQLLNPEERLKNWFWGNRILKHVELASGVHTDTLLHCRALVSDQALVRSLTDYLWRKYSTRNITVVVGVGTSAITLAINLAFRLNADVTFTFFDPSSKKEGEIPKHYIVEVDPSIETNKESKVLILDDVISRGEVAKDLVNKVICRGVSANQIIHLSLFRLGEEELELVDGVEYTQLCQIPDVHYAKDQKTCPMCLRGESFVHEWDA
jgi:orotate phosphoribosyltransferase